jgi:hypothetical protein
MASTDIDGTPLVMLTALEAEYIVELLTAMDELDDWGDGRKPMDMPVYRKLTKFLDDIDVQCYLEDYYDELICERIENELED